jgi:glutamate racemase
MVKDCAVMQQIRSNGQHVLVVDSGVGGVTIAEKIRLRLPSADISLLMDNDFFPYGGRDEDALRARLTGLIGGAVDRLNPDLVVVGCNTASTSALAVLRERLPVPIVGTVPALKPAAASSGSGVIGLIATKTTLASPYIDDLIAQHANGARVLRQATPGLVALAEAKLRRRPISIWALRDQIAPLFEGEGGDDLDTVVLGCTHFPLLLPELELAAPWQVSWVDSGEAIARRVVDLLADGEGDEDLPRPAIVESALTAFVTAWTPSIGVLRQALAGHGFAELCYMPCAAAMPRAPRTFRMVG